MKYIIDIPKDKKEEITVSKVSKKKSNKGCLIAFSIVWFVVFVLVFFAPAGGY